MTADSLTAIHHQIFRALNPALASDGGTPLAVHLARFASTALPDLLLLLLLVALWAGPAAVRRTVMLVFASMALAWLSARALQALWPQPRPFMVGLGVPWLPHAPSESFPSMHATVSGAFAASLSFNSRWPVSLMAGALAILIAWSRVCLGLHFPGDVLAGVALGTVAAGVTHLCLSPMRMRWLQCMGRRRVRRHWPRSLRPGVAALPRA